MLTDTTSVRHSRHSTRTQRRCCLFTGEARTPYATAYKMGLTNAQHNAATTRGKPAQRLLTTVITGTQRQPNNKVALERATAGVRRLGCHKRTQTRKHANVVQRPRPARFWQRRPATTVTSTTAVIVRVVMKPHHKRQQLSTIRPPICVGNK